MYLITKKYIKVLGLLVKKIKIIINSTIFSIKCLFGKVNYPQASLLKGFDQSIKFTPVLPFRPSLVNCSVAGLFWEACVTALTRSVRNNETTIKG